MESYTFNLVGSLLLFQSVIAVGVALRILYLQDCCQLMQQEIDAQLTATQSLEHLCDQYRFESEWNDSVHESSRSAVRLFDHLRRWSRDQKSFHGWLLWEDGTSLSSCQSLPLPIGLTVKLKDLAPVILDRKKNSDLFSGVASDLNTLYVFQCAQNQSHSSLLILSQLPCSDSAQSDFEWFAKLATRVQCDRPFPTMPAVVPKNPTEPEDQLAREILEIRSMLDAEFHSPEQMAQAYLGKLAEFTGAQRATLYLSNSRSEPMTVVASGEFGLDRGTSQTWEAGEVAILQKSGCCSNPCLIITPELVVDIDVSIPFRSGVILSSQIAEEKFGRLFLTYAEPSTPHQSEILLVEWATPHLIQQLQKEQERAEVIRQARHDSLTRLANRRTFDEILERSVRLSQSSNEYCSLIMLDVDHFKSINDRFGHPAGDFVLVSIAAEIKRLSESLRLPDHALAARFGGEEFALVLPHVSAEGAHKIAERLRRIIEGLSLNLAEGPAQITVSLGVATTSGDLSDSIQLLEQADSALYRAKNSGRNRVCSHRTSA